MILDTLDNYRLLQKRNNLQQRSVNEPTDNCAKGCMPDAEKIGDMEVATPSHLREK